MTTVGNVVVVDDAVADRKRRKSIWKKMLTTPTPLASDMTGKRERSRRRRIRKKIALKTTKKKKTKVKNKKCVGGGSNLGIIDSRKSDSNFYLSIKKPPPTSSSPLPKRKTSFAKLNAVYVNCCGRAISLHFILFLLILFSCLKNARIHLSLAWEHFRFWFSLNWQRMQNTNENDAKHLSHFRWYFFCSDFVCCRWLIFILIRLKLSLIRAKSSWNEPSNCYHHDSS